MKPALRLVQMENEEPKLWIDPRKNLIKLFNEKFVLETGKKNPFPYGACMKWLQDTFEIDDRKTGETFIEYPEEQTWIEQLNGFFQDEFAKRKRGFHFTYLLKQYGSFVTDYKRPETKLKPKNVMFFCTDCQKNHRHFEECEK